MIPSLSVDRHPCAIRSFVRLSLIATLLMSQLTPMLTPPAAAAPVAGVVQTIGDFLSLGANTVRELQEAIQIAGAEYAGLSINSIMTSVRSSKP